MTMVYLVQHGDKERVPGDPGLTELGRVRLRLRPGGCMGWGCTGYTAARYGAHGGQQNLSPVPLACRCGLTAVFAND